MPEETVNNEQTSFWDRLRGFTSHPAIAPAITAGILACCGFLYTQVRGSDSGPETTSAVVSEVSPTSTATATATMEPSPTPTNTPPPTPTPTVESSDVVTGTTNDQSGGADDCGAPPGGCPDPTPTYSVGTDNPKPPGQTVYVVEALDASGHASGVDINIGYTHGTDSLDVWIQTSPENLANIKYVQYSSEPQADWIPWTTDDADSGFRMHISNPGEGWNLVTTIFLINGSSIEGRFEVNLSP